MSRALPLPRLVGPPLVVRERYDRQAALSAGGMETSTCGWFYLCLSIIASAGLAEQLAENVATLQARWRSRVGSPRRGSATQVLNGALPSEPVIDAAAVRRIAGCSGRAAKTAVNRLIEGGVIKQIGERQRGRRFEAVGLFALLDDLEHGASGDVVAATQHQRNR